MKNYILSLVVMLATTAGGCANALRRAADASEVLGHVVLVCDGFSTYASVEAGGEEGNPILGQHPSGMLLTHYFGAVGAVDFMVNRSTATLLRNRPTAASLLRLAMNLTLVGFETHAVYGNAVLGASHGVGPCGV